MKLSWSLPGSRDLENELEFNGLYGSSIPSSFWSFLCLEEEFYGTWKGTGLHYNSFLPYSDISESIKDSSSSVLQLLYNSGSGVRYDISSQVFIGGGSTWLELKDAVLSLLGQAYRERLDPRTYIKKEDWNKNKRYLLAYKNFILKQL